MNVGIVQSKVAYNRGVFRYIVVTTETECEARRLAQLAKAKGYRVAYGYGDDSWEVIILK
jgi:hypothetical protein